jgi:hypothetical protein
MMRVTSFITQYDWLDNEGFFVKGQYVDEKLETVVENDIGYIYWILDQCEVSNEEYEIFHTILNR